MQNPSTQHSFPTSSFRKYDNYDDDAYEMIQEGSDLNRYPTVDDLSSQNTGPSSGPQKEPSSPTFSYAFQNPTARASTNASTTRTVSNRESDLTKQMAQKIKKQAEQLHELSNYKLLCEQRIMELAPGHPLPVQQSHLGTYTGNNQQMAELKEILQGKEEEIVLLQSQLNQYSNRKSPMKHGREESGNNTMKFIGGDDIVGSYNVLSGKYKALLEEKQTLEESLRNETLVHEEQRAYTEILKRMLDEKFDESNIGKWITGLPEVGKIDAMLEVKTLHEKLNHQQKELEYFRQTFQGKSVEMSKSSDEIEKLTKKTDELTKENLRLSEANIRLNQSLKTYEAEFKNLEEEKSNLIDFAEQQENKAEKYGNDYNELNNRYEVLDEANRELVEQINEANNQMANLQEELTNLRNANSELEEQLTALQDQYDTIVEANQQLTSRQKEVEHRLATEEKDKKTDYEEINKLRKESSELAKLKVNKEREINEVKSQLEELEEERVRLQETARKKEFELQNKLIQTKREYEDELNRFEDERRAFEENQTNLKSVIDKNNNEIAKILKQLNAYKEENKKLEETLHEVQNLNTMVQNENLELRELLTQTERDNQVREDDDLMVSQELNRLKEETERNFYKVTELSNLNATLEKKLAEKDKEVAEYEDIVNESKKRGEKERQNKLDELKRLYDENGELKNELHSLKEQNTKASTALTLKEQELALIKTHLDKKTQQTLSLIEENRTLKQKAEDLDYLQDQLNTMRNESDRTARGIREYEEQIENKNFSLKNTLSKLDNAEKELFTTLSNLNELKRERADLLAENTRIQKKLEEMKHEKDEAEIEKAAHEEDYVQLMKDYEKAQKNLSRTTHDLEDLSARYNELIEEFGGIREEEKSYRSVLQQTGDVIKSLLGKVKQYVTVYNEMLVTSPDALAILGKRFRTLLDTFDGYQSAKDAKEKGAIVKTTEYVREVMEVLLEELENLGRRVVDLKQDLTIGNQRVTTLERKCMNMSTEEAHLKQREMELRRELETLRDEKELISRDKSSSYSREVKIEKENAELKKEVGKLLNELKDSRSNLKNLDQENARLHTTVFKQQENQDIKGQDIALIQEKYKIAQKEKKSYEEILQRLCSLFANPELQRLIMDIVKLQGEIDQVEREKYALELKLGEIEADYKLYIKKTPNLSPSRSSARRSEIEIARTDLNNAISQLSILRKRKSILLEELKSFEVFEKRRYETSVETEKSLFEAKRQLQELKSQNHSLEKANTDLKDHAKTVTKERHMLDYENMKLRYPSFAENKDQNNIRTFTNKYTEQDPVDTSYTYHAEREAGKSEYKREGRSETQRMLTGVSGIETAGVEHEGWENKGLERSFTDRNNLRKSEMYGGFVTEKKDMSYSRVDHETSQQKMRLRDRLDQAKNVLSSMKKSFDREDLH